MSTFLMTGEITHQIATDFYKWALDLRSVKKQLLLSSCGGDVGLMIGMFDLIVEHDIEIFGVGILQSAAAVLFQAGAKRWMYPNSLLRYHEMERDKDTQDMSDPDWYLLTKMVAMVVPRTGLSIPEGHDLFDGKFITAQRAMELGLCDGIKNTGDANGTINRVSGSEGSDSGEGNSSAPGWGFGGSLGDLLVFKTPEA